MGLFNKSKSTDDYANEGSKLFDDGKYAEAIEIWLEAPDSLERPLNARSEAVWFLTAVAEYLMRAYMIAGEEILEDEDEKYFALIKDLI